MARVCARIRITSTATCRRTAWLLDDDKSGEQTIDLRTDDIGVRLRLAVLFSSRGDLFPRVERIGFSSRRDQTIPAIWRIPLIEHSGEDDMGVRSTAGRS